MQSVKPQLILDVGGVLISNLTSFWHNAAAQAGVPYEQLRAAYRKEIRDGLWNGRMTELEFWSWMEGMLPALRPSTARELLAASMKLLPAFERLPAWSGLADIHILSNHRVEWIGPLLQPALANIASLTVSSEAGCYKPHPDIYRLASARLAAGAPALYVDDQPKNFPEAQRLGWATLLADEQGQWLDRVEALLHPGSLDAWKRC